MSLKLYTHKINNALGTHTGNLFFYWKARVGLFTLLKAMDIKEGDEVILPAFTCVVVPNAILYLGATPIYIDVSPDTYNFDIDLVEKVITEKTKVIICQNTYGLSSNLEELATLAKKHKLFTIEDCTHGFGGTYNDIPNGLSCDSTELVKFRNRIGKEGFEKIFSMSVAVHGKPALEDTVNIDTTAQEKNITYPTDAKLAIKIISRLHKVAKYHVIQQRITYKKEVKGLHL